MEYTSLEQIERFDDPHTSKPVKKNKEHGTKLLASLLKGRNTINKRIQATDIIFNPSNLK